MHTKEDPTDVLGRIEEVVLAGFPENYEGIDGTRKALQEALGELGHIDSVDEDGKEDIASILIFAAGCLARLAIAIDPPVIDD